MKFLVLPKSKFVLSNVILGVINIIAFWSFQNSFNSFLKQAISGAISDALTGSTSVDDSLNKIKFFGYACMVLAGLGILLAIVTAIIAFIKKFDWFNYISLAILMIGDILLFTTLSSYDSNSNSIFQNGGISLILPIIVLIIGVVFAFLQKPAKSAN